MNFYSDSLIKIENVYVDNQKNFTINFEAKLKNKESDKYHFKVNLSNKNYTIQIDSLRKSIKFSDEYSNNLINKSDSSKSGMFNGFYYKEIKRRHINQGFDTNQNISNKLPDSCLSKIYYDMRRKNRWNIFYSDDYDKICINYFPDANLSKQFYVFQLKKRKKYDKRYIKIVTIPIDIITSPIQIIYFYGRRYYGTLCNTNRKS